MACIGVVFLYLGKMDVSKVPRSSNLKLKRIDRDDYQP